MAGRIGMTTVGLTGEAGAEPLAGLSDILIAVPSTDCARIQECHEFVCHFVAGAVEERMFAGAGPGSCGG